MMVSSKLPSWLSLMEPWTKILYVSPTVEIHETAEPPFPQKSSLPSMHVGAEHVPARMVMRESKSVPRHVCAIISPPVPSTEYHTPAPFSSTSPHGTGTSALMLELAMLPTTPATLGTNGPIAVSQVSFGGCPSRVGKVVGTWIGIPVGAGLGGTITTGVAVGCTLGSRCNVGNAVATRLGRGDGASVVTTFVVLVEGLLSDVTRSNHTATAAMMMQIAQHKMGIKYLRRSRLSSSSSSYSSP
mmetsp:Transcript_24930/g.69968  ORF Transcript_24930/g.69968 Transcript_24930/m.69968 type:complete len:243 (-) Transcript_24930:38-766(-)